MESFVKKVVQLRIPVLIVSLALLVPSFFGYVGTRVNYDILSYLPKDIETMVGQDILVDEFGTGAFSMLVVEGMEPKDVTKLKQAVEQVEHVEKVIWYDSVMDISVPAELMPGEIYEAFNSGDATMMAVIFDETTSADGTMEAIEAIRKVTGRNCFLSGMSAVVTDTKNLSEKEAPIYVCIAVLLSCLVLSLTMDSFLLPVIFLLSIGMAIIYNLGSNIFMGEISYITKALSAVLQLGVTMDYSIFLWHSYQENRQEASDKNDVMACKEYAMAKAISATVTSVVSSSMTTVAGFIALCFMSFTLGMDLGIVMAKGVIFGVIACVTILPSMILVFDKALEKTKHKAFLPDMKGIGAFITHMLLINSDLPAKDVKHMTQEMEAVDGVNWILGLNAMKGPSIPDEMIPADLTDSLMDENWQLLLVGSQYKVASGEVNSQCERLSAICKSYDPKGMLVGEAPCTKDLIEITDKDFNTVSIVSIGVIFLIILLVFRSVLLPVVLVSVIEMAIFVNMGIPYYTGTEIPFIASVVIGTIQLGATVDYAILMTTRYRKERFAGAEKKEAVTIACQSSIKSIVVSALSFFAATFGVGLYSNIDMISSLCTLMARGALISMVTVIFVLPSMFMVFDRLLVRGREGKEKSKKNKIKQEVVST